MLKTNKKFTRYLIIAVLIFLFGTSIVSAATVGFSPSSGNYNVGDTIRAKIIVSSSIPINAVASHISFPTNLLTLSSLSKTGSIISLWAQEPSFSNSNGTADLEGVILNGYAGNGGNVITLVFKAKSEGKATVKFLSASVLANDGNGTELISGNSPYIVTIAKAIEKAPVVEPTPTTIENVVEKTKEVVQEVRQVEQANNLPDYSLVIVLMLIIIILLILIIMFGIYYINKFKKYIKKRLKKTEEDVSKEFETLEGDVYKEAIIEHKVKENEKLSDEEKTALVDFKQDIKETEKSIIKEIRDIEDNN